MKLNNSTLTALVKQMTHFLIRLGLVALVFTACFLFLKHHGLASALFISKGVYHVLNLNPQGFVFVISLFAIIWLVFRYAFYLAIWLIIWIFYNPIILKTLAIVGIK